MGLGDGIGSYVTMDTRPISERLQGRIEHYRSFPVSSEAAMAACLAEFDASIRQLADSCSAVFFCEPPEWYDRLGYGGATSLAFYIGETFYVARPLVLSDLRPYLSIDSWHPADQHLAKKVSSYDLHDAITFLIDEAAKVAAREPVGSI